MKVLKTLVDEGRLEEAGSRLMELARDVDDYPAFLKLCRYRAQLADKGWKPRSSKVLRVALLGGATTDMLGAPLQLAVEATGFGCEFFSSAYNTFAREMLEPDSETAAFAPDVAVLVNTPANQPCWPAAGDDGDRVKGLVDEVCEYWLGLCASLHDNTGCEVILNNFHPLTTRPLGNFGTKLPWERNNFLRRVNLELGDRAPPFVHINDVDGLAARYGLGQWFDPRYWFHAKQPVSFDCLVPYVKNTARIIGALFGRTAKCLVLDLDNTLWGGVVGDDGVEGIAIGEGDAVGEAYKAFQEHIRSLEQRGLMLAVCSKNEEANAIAPFRERPEMVLRYEDFVAFKANWTVKTQNLQEIAAELNIGLDSLVFVDDNPAERELVRQTLPMVKVVELSEDPADYPRLLDESGWFEITALSDEDRQRTRQYKENVKRERLKGSVTDYAAYLESLEQKAVVRPFEAKHLDRITQLINKTNQFNLTTRRMGRSEVESLMGDPNSLTAYVRLADRFGDNGLISVFCGRRDGDEMWIDEWLMSCRVFNRGVEQLLCNYVVDASRELGVSALRGVYIPTERNGLVREHYKNLAFSLLHEGDDGSSHWRLELDDHEPHEVAIELVEDY